MALSLEILAAQRMQMQALRAFGHEVKNTFIDDIAPPVKPTARRTCSVPAASRLAGDCDLVDDVSACSCPLSTFAAVRGRPESRTVCKDAEPCFLPIASSSQCRDLSLASTASTRTSTGTDISSTATETTSCSSSSTPDFCSGFNWAEASVPEAEEAAETEADEELVALVERECAFLRLTGEKACYEETTHLRRQRGVERCVVFYCKGLPWAKRAKWLLPLLWSVAAVLRARGVFTKVQSGELYAQMPGAQGEPADGSRLVRLDFAAARN
jgi:hypothetical protein